jgi:hypothetical protein
MIAIYVYSESGIAALKGAAFFSDPEMKEAGHGL